MATKVLVVAALAWLAVAAQLAGVYPGCLARA
jgi:hypothetical protein